PPAVVPAGDRRRRLLGGWRWQAPLSVCPGDHGRCVEAALPADPYAVVGDIHAPFLPGSVHCGQSPPPDLDQPIQPGRAAGGLTSGSARAGYHGLRPDRALAGDEDAVVEYGGGTLVDLGRVDTVVFQEVAQRVEHTTLHGLGVHLGIQLVEVPLV